MIINGKHLQSICFDATEESVNIIDQTQLPHDLVILGLSTLADAVHAISSMQVRGAPLIGVTAAYGVYLALREDPQSKDDAIAQLLATRPTAVNLAWALQRVASGLAGHGPDEIAARALEIAQIMEKEDIAVCEAIGEHGAQLLEQLWQTKQQSQTHLNLLTHCNAGALATVDWGTALSVVYKAVQRGIPVHVWVDETRPRNQGAALTCWELGQQGIAHTLVVDNAGGHLMQQGKVDVCVVGSDRTTINGDVCNKIGTYLKALAASDNDVPFYAALPLSSIDFSLGDGHMEIPIEQRGSEEVTHVAGIDAAGELRTVRITADGVAVSNYGFDITPARLVTGIITERGVFAANRDALEKIAAGSC